MGIKISDLIDCTLCTNFINDCCDYCNEAKEQFMVYGKNSAKQCKYFSNRTKISAVLDKKEALEYILGEDSDFILVSGKTGKRFRYRLEKRKSNCYKKQQFIYWLIIEDDNEELVYGGVIFFDENDNKFKFGKGARGNVINSDIRIISLLYVLNNLYLKRYSISVTIIKINNKIA